MKNGKIELLRFYFCMSVFLFHIATDFPDKSIMLTENITFWREGRFGVEFFFLVSGYLAASSIFKTLNTTNDLAKDTGRYIVRKIKGILPYHILIILLTLIYRVVCLEQEFIVTFVQALPNIFFLQMSGLPGKNLINVEWYISSMLLALCILYPICKKYYSFFIRIIAPIAGYLIIGFLIRRIGYLGNPKTFLYFTYSGNLQAMGEICLGMFSFEVVRCIKESKSFMVPKWGLSLIELACYVLVFYYMMTDTFSNEYSGTMCFVLCTAIALSFSELTWGCKFFNNKICYFLGKFSLPLYLSQNLVRVIVNNYLGSYRFRYILLGELLLSFILSLILLFIVERFSSFMGTKQRIKANR